MNRKGAELTIGTLVIIVLAIIVLVVLALGFGAGWTNLWSKITAFFGGADNIGTVIQACNLACASNSKYAFCTQVREVRSESEVFKVDTDLKYKAEGTDSKKIKASCEQLGSHYGHLKFEACDTVDC